jgi:hypothetical protein
MDFFISYFMSHPLIVIIDMTLISMVILIVYVFLLLKSKVDKLYDSVMQLQEFVSFSVKSDTTETKPC